MIGIKEIEIQLIINQRYMFDGDSVFSFDTTGNKIHIVFKDGTIATIPWRNVGMLMVKYKKALNKSKGESEE